MWRQHSIECIGKLREYLHPDLERISVGTHDQLVTLGECRNMYVRLRQRVLVGREFVQYNRSISLYRSDVRCPLHAHELPRDDDRHISLRGSR